MDVFRPRVSAADRDQRYNAWHRAVERSLNWSRETDTASDADVVRQLRHNFFGHLSRFSSALFHPTCAVIYSLPSRTHACLMLIGARDPMLCLIHGSAGRRVRPALAALV